MTAALKMHWEKKKVYILQMYLLPLVQVVGMVSGSGPCEESYTDAN